MLYSYVRRAIVYGITPVSLLTLAACGGSSTSVDVTPTISDEENALRIYSDVSGDLKQVFFDDQPVYARSAGTNAARLDFSAGTTQMYDANISIFKNNEGGLTLVVNGEDYELRSGDEAGDDQWVIDDDDRRYADVTILSGTIDDIFDDDTWTHYSELFTSFTSGDSFDTRAYSVFGTETQDSTLPVLGVISFSGMSEILLLPLQEFIGEPENQIKLFSSAQLNSDFSTGQISGALTDHFYDPPGDDLGQSISGTIFLDSSQFGVNAFEGTLSVDQAFGDAFSVIAGDSELNAGYSGAFYGPQAQEVGGVMTGSATIGGTEFNLLGGFHASQD